MSNLEEAIELYIKSCNLRDEGDKLWTEGGKIWNKGYLLRVESDKLRNENVGKLAAKYNKLWDKGYNICTEGDRVRADGCKLLTQSGKLLDKSNKLWEKELIRLFGFIPNFMKDIENYVESCKKE